MSDVIEMVDIEPGTYVWTELPPFGPPDPLPLNFKCNGKNYTAITCYIAIHPQWPTIPADAWDVGGGLVFSGPEELQVTVGFDIGDRDGHHISLTAINPDLVWSSIQEFTILDYQVEQRTYEFLQRYAKKGHLPRNNNYYSISGTVLNEIGEILREYGGLYRSPYSSWTIEELPIILTNVLINKADSEGWQKATDEVYIDRDDDGNPLLYNGTGLPLDVYVFAKIVENNVETARGDIVRIYDGETVNCAYIADGLPNASNAVYYIDGIERVSGIF